MFESHADSSTNARKENARSERNESWRASAKPDLSLWSEKRIAKYREALTMTFAPPIAVLRVPRLHLEVPVFDGTDELILNRGAGRIAGTAKPGEGGNVGIAAHRDGFFRGLKNVQLGDRIELETINRKLTYDVREIVIVNPYNVEVLRPRPFSLTLVTCYPFYFFGDAPQRYIVHATASSEHAIAIHNAHIY
jgi:sortase A